MIDSTIRRTAPENESERGVAAVGVIASLTALFSAAACCVLPMALASIGLGASGLAVFVPFRWPLALLSLAIVAAGWAFYLRKVRACEPKKCGPSAGRKANLAMLIAATVIVAITTIWGSIEQPIMRILGGA